MNLSATWSKSLLPPFLVMTVSVISLALLSQYLIDNSLQKIKSDVQLMRVISNQQVVCLQITKEMTNDELQGIPNDMSLDSLSRLLFFTQHILLTDSTVSSNAANYSYNYLNKAYSEFSAALDAALNSDSIPLYVKLLNKQKTYVEELQNLTIAISERSNEKTTHFQLYQRCIMFTSIVILTLEAVFVFFPAFGKIKKQNERLLKIAFNQSHLLRRPLANVKGLLHLMKISEGEEKEDLLAMAVNEVEQLDEVIHISVAEACN